MKSALVIAFVCAVSCLQLANADENKLPEFHSPEIQGIASNFILGVRKLKQCLMNHMSMINNQATLKQSFSSYDFLVSSVFNAKPECVTEEMQTLSSSAMTTFSACFPDKATINRRIQESQHNIAAVFNELKDVDQELLTITDAVDRAKRVAEVDIKYAGGFFMEVFNNIVKAAEPARQCIETAATSMRSTALQNIDKMVKCYSAN